MKLGKKVIEAVKNDLRDGFSEAYVLAKYKKEGINSNNLGAIYATVPRAGIENNPDMPIIAYMLIQRGTPNKEIAKATGYSKKEINVRKAWFATRNVFFPLESLAEEEIPEPEKGLKQKTVCVSDEKGDTEKGLIADKRTEIYMAIKHNKSDSYLKKNFGLSSGQIGAYKRRYREKFS